MPKRGNYILLLLVPHPATVQLSSGLSPLGGRHAGVTNAVKSSGVDKVSIATSLSGVNK